MNDQLRRPRRAFFVLALALCAGGAAVPGARAQDDGRQERMPIAGGTAALLQQCGIRAPVEPARAFRVLARAVHAATPPSKENPLSPLVVASLLDAARHNGGVATEDVPALLPLSTWQRDVFGRSIDAGGLASAIIGDRGASFLYYGLFSLDDETLAFFVAHPSILSSIYRNDAAVFADFAESITVRNGRVVLPGDEGAGPIWEYLVGSQATAPELFIARLLNRDEGRLAWMFDTVAHLDPAHQNFALGRPVAADPERRLEYVKAVYAAFVDFQRLAYPLPQRPLVHPPVDPSFVLATVAVTDGGRLAPPADTGLWTGPFAVTAGGASGAMTAPWLLEHILTISGRPRLDTFLFAQRVFADASRRGVRIDEAGLPAVLSAFPTHQALMLALERLGFVEPRDYALAVETADRLCPGGGLPASLRAAMFQGALAMLVRLHEVGTLDDKGAQGLARMLIALPAGDPTGYSDPLVQWIERSLMPVLADGRQAASMDAEEWLLDGLSGALAKRPTPVVQWEDQSYRVDLAAAERARLRHMLEKQRACSLSVALDLRRLASSSLDPTSAATLASLLSGIDLLDRGPLFGATVPARRDAIASDLRQLQRDSRDPGRVEDVRRRCHEVLDVLLADILAAHVYAIAIEEPESSLLLVDHAARTHDFDVGDPKRVGAWMLATNARADSNSMSLTRGSLLGVERALAVFSLRRLTLDSPAQAPAIAQWDAQGLAESASALNPFRLTDAARDAIASALERGRRRVAEVARDPAGLDTLVAGVGVERWRRRLIRWAPQDPDAVMQYLSLGEIAALGAPAGLPAEAQDWGVSQRFVDGSFDVRLPMRLAWHRMSGRRGAGLLAAQVADLPLRVAESLAALKLPSVLAHGVVQYATWDLISSIQMADVDDWLAVVRAVQRVTPDQMADYISALTADGPLVPVK
jgi:hypothetical protein